MIVRRDDVHADRQIANRVERYHTWPTLHRQTTGEHANRVLQIYVEIFGLPRAEVLYYASIHDAGEQYASDVQYGAKRDVPGLRDAINEAEQRGYEKLGIKPPQLTDEEFARVKIADLLEMWEFAKAELRMGNNYAQPVLEAGQAAIALATENFVDPAVYDWMDQRNRA